MFRATLRPSSLCPGSRPQAEPPPAAQVSVTPLADAPPPAATTLAEGGSSTAAMAGAAGGVGVLALLVGVWMWWRCRRPSEDSTSLADATSWPEVSDPEKGGNSILLGEAAVLGGC